MPPMEGGRERGLKYGTVHITFKLRQESEPSVLLGYIVFSSPVGEACRSEQAPGNDPHKERAGSTQGYRAYWSCLRHAVKASLRGQGGKCLVQVGPFGKETRPVHHMSAYMDLPRRRTEMYGSKAFRAGGVKDS